jgi:uncharacterized protein YoxC
LTKNEANANLIANLEVNRREFENFVSSKNHEFEVLKQTFASELDSQRQNSEIRFLELSNDFNSKYQKLDGDFQQKCRDEETVRSTLAEKIESWNELETTFRETTQKLSNDIEVEKKRFESEVEKNRSLSIALKEIQSENGRRGQEIESLKNNLSEKMTEFELFGQQKQSEHESAYKALRQDLTRSFEEQLSGQRNEFDSRIREMSGTISGLEFELNGRRLEAGNLSQIVDQKSKEFAKLLQESRLVFFNY